MRFRSTVAEIDLAALRNNYRLIKKLSGGVKVCAVVKADAYGHGAARVAEALAEEGADFFAVALAEEAVELRASGLVKPILVLGEQDPERADELAAIDASWTVSSLGFAAALSEAAVRARRRVKIHLKVETGMNRQGVEIGDIEKFAHVARGLPGIVFEGVYSHFADADNGDGRFTELQYSRFMSALKILESCGIKPGIRHIANSPTLVYSQDMRLDMVRSGILLYGLSPDSDPRIPEGFKPVMRFVTQISSIRTVKKGETVSYGRSFRAERETRLALLRVGYADGYLRAFSNRAEVLVRGARARVAGRVCMDMTVIDVTDIPAAQVGDEALLFGSRELPAGELAAIAGTIDYEISCLVSKRVPRIYVGENGEERE